MRIGPIILLIQLIMTCSCGYALVFDEKIITTGDSKLFAKTSTAQSSDLVDGCGPQSYHRVLSSLVDKVSQSTMSSLKSQYQLQSRHSIKDNYTYHSYKIVNIENRSNKFGVYRIAVIPNGPIYPGITPNRYSIRMSSPSGLQHEISIYDNSESNSNLSSDSEINFTAVGGQSSAIKSPEYKVRTSFNVIGNGDLTESVSEKSSKHPVDIAETSISGSFDVKSGLTEVLSSPENLDAKTEDVDISSETPPNDTLASDEADHLEKELIDGSITQDTYIAKMRALLEQKVITPNVYAAKIKSAYDHSLIKLDHAEYSDILYAATPETLKTLKSMITKGTITLEQFITGLKEMLIDDRISEVEYLAYIRPQFNNTTLNQYYMFKNETLDRLRKDAVNGTITIDQYYIRMDLMRSSNLINDTEYNNQTSGYIQETSDELMRMLLKGTITSDQFLKGQKERLDEGKITTQYYENQLGIAYKHNGINITQFMNTLPAVGGSPNQTTNNSQIS